MELAIALSTKICFCCGKQHKDDSEILIDQRFCTEETAKKRVEKMSKPSGYADCNQCEDYKKRGVILIGFDESKSDMSNIPIEAYRTGQFLVVKENFINKITKNKEIRKQAKEKRILFIPEELAKQLTNG